MRKASSFARLTYACFEFATPGPAARGLATARRVRVLHTRSSFGRQLRSGNSNELRCKTDWQSTVESEWATPILQDHEHIRRMSNALNAALPIVVKRSKIDFRVPLLANMAEEFSNRHHEMEEAVLMKVLESHGFPEQKMMGVLRNEHMEIHSLLAKVSWAANCSSWSDLARPQLQANGQELFNLVKEHLRKEEEELIPAISAWASPIVKMKLSKRLADSMRKRRDSVEWREAEMERSILLQELSSEAEAAAPTVKQ